MAGGTDEAGGGADGVVPRVEGDVQTRESSDGHLISPTKGFNGKILPPFLAKFQRLNEEHNKRLLIERLVCVFICLNLRKKGIYLPLKLVTHLPEKDYRMAARQNKEARTYLARMDDIRTLLVAFGVHLHEYDPGVAGYLQPSTDMFPKKIDLGANEWAWAEPLLRELLQLRHQAHQAAYG